MKPSELVKRTNWWDARGNAHIERRLAKYNEKDCVVAYLKERLGTIFIIKGKCKYFAFIHSNPMFNFGGYDYKLTDLSLKDAVNVMGDGAVIIDKDLYGKMIKTILVEAL